MKEDQVEVESIEANKDQSIQVQEANIRTMFSVGTQITNPRKRIFLVFVFISLISFFLAFFFLK